MAKLLAAAGMSHAYTFLEIDEWAEFREWSVERFRREHGGVDPPLPAGFHEETLEGNRARFERVQQSLHEIRRRIIALNPDVILSIGDDQAENYQETCIPQIAVVTTSDAETVDFFHERRRITYPVDQALAKTLLSELVESGFDVAETRELPGGQLLAHAHSQPLQFLYPEGQVPIVVMFANGMHMPAPTPARCYALGVRIRQILESIPDEKRVVVIASGGLSHFVNSFPWDYYEGPELYGAVHPDFDRQLLDWMANGDGEKLATLTSNDLVNHGDVELRQHIVVLGAVGAGRPDLLVYEVFWRAGLGMWAGYWPIASR